MVAAAGTTDSPRILERKRIVIADPELPGSKQPFHAAAEMPFSKAEAHVRKVMDSCGALAIEALEAAIKALRAQGHEVVICAVLRASGRPLPVLKAILASHALIHTAEGEMFRDVLVAAAETLALPVACIREKELDFRRLDSLGRLIGPPWTQDQKCASAAAFQALNAGL
jgi:hypothetical protein